MIKVKFNKDVHTIRLGSEEHNGQPGGDNNSDNNSNSKVITLQTIKQILAEKTGLAAVDIKLIRDGRSFQKTMCMSILHQETITAAES